VVVERHHKPVILIWQDGGWIKRKAVELDTGLHNTVTEILLTNANDNAMKGNTAARINRCCEIVASYTS
jgi:hypothetical protein